MEKDGRINVGVMHVKGGENKVKWGIIGTARIAERELIPALHKSDLAEPYAVCSRDLEKAKRYAERNNIPNYYGKYKDLLSDPEIEIVYNPLPNFLHKEWTIKAAESGKNVLCEKPLALNVEEAREMFDVCEANDVLLMEGFMYRFHPMTRRVKELLEEGAMGTPKFLRASHSFPLISMNRPDDIRWKEEMGGGSLMDLGCYCVNTARYFFGGEPRRVTASSLHYPDFTAEAQVEGILEFSDDRTAIIDSSFLLYHRAKYEVVGESGKILIGNAYRSEGEDLKIEIFREEERRSEHIEGTDEFRLEVDNFNRAATGEEEPRISREDSIGNMRTIEALYESAENNRPVELD